MEPFDKELFEDFEKSSRHQLGRILRNISLAGMGPFAAGVARPHVDVYETSEAMHVLVDAAGADPASLAVVVDGNRVRVSGRRSLPPQNSVTCVHQLEIEFGDFDRVVTLPCGIDVERVSSTYRDGLLHVVLPKRGGGASIRIKVEKG